MTAWEENIKERLKNNKQCFAVYLLCLKIHFQSSKYTVHYVCPNFNIVTSVVAVYLFLSTFQIVTCWEQN